MLSLKFNKLKLSLVNHMNDNFNNILEEVTGIEI